MSQDLKKRTTRCHRASTINLEEIYVDQAYKYFSRPGFHFFAAYTPYGIKLKDGEFSHRIVAGEECPVRLAWEIARCYSLHIVIRSNLLKNLRNRYARPLFRYRFPRNARKNQSSARAV